jgi:hypothetical protein
MQGMYLAGRQGKRVSMRKGGLPLSGEHHCSEQVQSVLPLSGQQGRCVVTCQRPVTPRIIRIGPRCGERRNKPGDLRPRDLVQPRAIKVIKAVEVGRIQLERIKC